MIDGRREHPQRRDPQQQKHQQTKATRTAGHGGGNSQCRTQRTRDIHFAETRRPSANIRRAISRGQAGARCRRVDQDLTGHENTRRRSAAG